MELGFQASATLQQGAIVAEESGAGGPPLSTVGSASWCLNITPVSGWGNDRGSQQATAGWLSTLAVFEPHWQVRGEVPANGVYRGLIVRDTHAAVWRALSCAVEFEGRCR